MNGDETPSFFDREQDESQGLFGAVSAIVFNKSSGEEGAHAPAKY